MPSISRSVSMGRRRGGGAWSPSALSPLEWYRMDLANLTLAPKVSAVADLSGNGRHATQSTAGEQPVTGTIAGLKNAPCIVCNNTGLLLPTYTIPAPSTVMIAGEVSATPGQYGWFYCQDALFGVFNGKYGVPNSVTATAPGIGTPPVPIVVLYYLDSYSAGGLRIAFSGTTYPSTSTPAGFGAYSIGYRPGLPAQSMSCKIAEVIAIPGTLSGAGLTSLSAYALARYGMSF